MEKRNIILICIGFLLVLSILFFTPKNFFQKTGFAALSASGCCLDTCSMTSSLECSENFIVGQNCTTAEGCNVGCCIDTEGYCHTNYLEKNCENQNNTFVDVAECDILFECLLPPEEDSLRWSLDDTAQSLGFDSATPRLSEGEWALPSATPISGKVGDFFTFRMHYLASNPPNFVSVTLASEDYNSTIQLYDDGRNNDGNANDNVYGRLWSSSSHPDFEGILKINFSSVDSDYSDYILLSSTNCIPITKPWYSLSSRRNIIFVGSLDPTEQANFESKVNSIIYSTSYLQLVQGDDPGVNFYIIRPPENNINKEQAYNKVKQECTYYDEANDLIIFLNQNQNDCQQYSGLIDITPEFILNQDLNPIGIEAAFSEFCNKITTDQRIEEQRDQDSLAPEVQILDLDLENKQITFSATDNRDTQMIYEIFVVNATMTQAELISSGSILNGTTVTTGFTTNLKGEFMLVVEVGDSDNNWGADSRDINLN